MRFIYPGTRFKNENGWPTSAEPFYGRRHVVLVLDSSFLKDYDNGHLWAEYSLLKARYEARVAHKEFRFFIPSNIIGEYNAFLSRKRRDSRGLRFANYTLEDLLEIQKELEFSPKSIENATFLAREAWERSYSDALTAENPKLNKGKLRRKLRTGPTLPDLSVIIDAIILAEQGAVVYVASSDLRDIINPLRHLDMPNIYPLPPSSIQQQYFRGSGKWLEAVITEEVLAHLPLAIEQKSTYPVVVFEIKVGSGDAVFDAGVGILQQEYDRPLELPSNYEGIERKHRVVPIIHIPSLGKNMSASAAAKLRLAFMHYPGQQLLVYVYENPRDPLLVEPSDPVSPKWYLPFIVSMGYLRYQTNSHFAKGNFVPDSKKPFLVQR